MSYLQHPPRCSGRWGGRSGVMDPLCRQISVCDICCTITAFYVYIYTTYIPGFMDHVTQVLSYLWCITSEGVMWQWLSSQCFTSIILYSFQCVGGTEGRIRAPKSNISSVRVRVCVCVQYRCTVPVSHSIVYTFILITHTSKYRSVECSVVSK